MDQSQSLTQRFFLAAGECDAEGRMPLTLIAQRIIEVATAHANSLGIGYATLIQFNIGWVLSRLSIEMIRYPKINEHYNFTTWIESINRRFSERNFAITTDDGETIGYARTIWSAIDFVARSGADLSCLDLDSLPKADLPCPINKTPRIGTLQGNIECNDYRFSFCDLDFNRHVNTIRYLELMMDQWPLEHYDVKQIKRIDLLFHNECRFGENVTVRVANPNADVSDCELSRQDVRTVGARFSWIPRQK